MSRHKATLLALLLMLTSAAQASLHVGHLLPKKIHLVVHNHSSVFWVAVKDLVHGKKAIVRPEQTVTRKYYGLIPSTKLSYANRPQGPFKSIPGCVDHMSFLNRNVSIVVREEGGKPWCELSQ